MRAGLVLLAIGLVAILTGVLLALWLVPTSPLDPARVVSTERSLPA